MLERLAGKGRLFHCRWCRLQFFDRRPLMTDLKVAIPETEVEAAAEKSAGSAQ